MDKEYVKYLLNLIENRMVITASDQKLFDDLVKELELE
jgi:hypothetical protein